MSLTNLIIATKIVFIGFLIYRIQCFLRRHRTWEACSLLLTFTFLILIALESNSPPQIRHWLPIVLMAFIFLIAAEPELAFATNKFLEIVNSNSLTRSGSTLGEIAQAAGAMAATKTGALIAFERNDSLLKFGDTGIEINADIKKELLTTLFTKDTPTHDGGLLIRRGRATHCGAVFPLSDRKQIENGLGTRHRAALGLTEKTDAVCLVVSEEEGTISLAKRGELIYSVPSHRLERTLRKLLTGKDGPQFYPLHYIKRFAQKKVEPHFIYFSKSLGKNIYDLVVASFWFFVLLFWNSYEPLNLAAFKKPLGFLLGSPWIFASMILFVVNLALLFINQSLKVNAVTAGVRQETSLLFLAIFQRKFSRDDLRAVALKREGPRGMLWSLSFLRKKRGPLFIDRTTSKKALADAAKQIRDILRIELIT